MQWFKLLLKMELAVIFETVTRIQPYILRQKVVMVKTYFEKKNENRIWCGWVTFLVTEWVSLTSRWMKCVCFAFLIFLDVGNEKIVQTLVNSGADVNLKDVSGWTPLHLAAYRGYLFLYLAIEILCDAMMFSWENWRNSARKLLTLLIDFDHCLRTLGHQSIVKFLLENGADVGARNGFQSTPLDWSAASGNFDYSMTQLTHFSLILNSIWFGMEKI